MCSGKREFFGGLNQFKKFQKYFRALHCSIRWVMIRHLVDKELSTSEIYELLEKSGEGISKSTLYYHLSELEEAGIIGLAGYGK